MFNTVRKGVRHGSVRVKVRLVVMVSQLVVGLGVWSLSRGWDWVFVNLLKFRHRRFTDAIAVRQACSPPGGDGGGNE